LVPSVALAEGDLAPTAVKAEAPSSDSATTSPRLDGTDLYLAQLVAALGAEGVIAIASLFPPMAWIVAAVSPGVGALAVDWVGREMGGVVGSQSAALITSYGMFCVGCGSMVVGGFVSYFAIVLGPLLLLMPATAPFGIAVLAAGVVPLLFGSMVMVARPFVLPIAWAAFASQPDLTDGALPGTDTGRGSDRREHDAPVLSTGVAF